MFPSLFKPRLFLLVFILAACADLGGGPGRRKKGNQSWTHPTSLSSSAISLAGEQATFPRVAIGDNGEALIVFLQRLGATSHVFFSEYREEKWKHPEEPSDAISLDFSSDHQVAMDKNGNAIIVWQQWDGANTMIYKSEYRNEKWKHPEKLTDHISLAGQDAQFPAVAMDDSGNAVIAWIQNDGQRGRVFKSEYRNGEWVHPKKLADNIAPDAGPISRVLVSMSNSSPSNLGGTGLVAWEQDNGVHEMVYLSEYKGGAWSYPSGSSDHISVAGENVELWDVSVSDKGGAWVAWAQRNNAGLEAIFISEYSTGAWSHPEDLSDFEIALNTSTVADLDLESDSKGNALLAWIQSNGSMDQVFMSEYREGKWTHPLSQAKHISPGGEVAVNVDIALNSKAEAIVVWQQYNGQENTVLMSQKRDSVWRHPKNLQDNISIDGQTALSPRVALSESSEALVSWYQYDGSEFRIYSSSYR